MKQKTLAKIPTAKLERFLLELVNIRQDEKREIYKDAAIRFEKRFKEMLSDVPAAKQWAQWGGVKDYRLSKQSQKDVEENLEWLRISTLSFSIQSIWRGPTPAEKQIRAMMLQGTLTKAGNPTFGLTHELFQPGPFFQAILHLLKSADRALICLKPDCPTPHFFRKGKRQQYCSEKCAEFGQREAKRKWWNEKGNQWRKKHLKKQRTNPQRKEQK